MKFEQTIKALIVDDESLARRRVIQMLHDYPRMCLTKDASSIAEARVILAGFTPDVAFLDIQLFGENGFDLVQYLPPSCHIVFVTAHDAYAIRAFEINVLDYLLKPIEPERFAMTMDRLLGEPVQATQEMADSEVALSDCLFLKSGDDQRFVKVDHIGAITSQGEYTEVHLMEERPFLFRCSLKTWEMRLPKSHFIRIHRQAIINFDYIERLETLPDSRYVVHLRDELPNLETSHRLTPVFRTGLKGRDISLS